MTDTCAVARPDGTTYRARLTPSAYYWDEEETGTTGVTVLRSHDPDQVRSLADKVLRDHAVGDLSKGELVWLRKPYGDWEYERVEASKRGAVPAVVFLVVEA